MKVVWLALLLTPLGNIEVIAADGKEPRLPNHAAFLANLPIPKGDPARWQWREPTSLRVIQLLGWQGPLSAHHPGRVVPRTIEYPLETGGTPPEVGRGHGGVLYLNWTTGLRILMDLSIDVTFHTEPKPAAAVYLQLYDFPVVVPGSSSKVGQYFGFQYRFEKGKLKTQVIWTRWKTRDKANAWVAAGGWIESAGYEDDFVGIRYPYEWTRRHLHGSSGHA